MFNAGKRPTGDDEGAGLPALGTGTLHENTRSHKGVTILNQRVFETTIYVSPSDLFDGTETALANTSDSR